jgi:hypothetical protein
MLVDALITPWRQSRNVGGQPDVRELQKPVTALKELRSFLRATLVNVITSAILMCLGSILRLNCWSLVYLS